MPLLTQYYAVVNLYAVSIIFFQWNKLKLWVTLSFTVQYLQCTYLESTG